MPHPRRRRRRMCGASRCCACCSRRVKRSMSTAGRPARCAPSPGAIQGSLLHRSSRTLLTSRLPPRRSGLAPLAHAGAPSSGNSRLCSRAPWTPLRSVVPFDGASGGAAGCMPLGPLRSSQPCSLFARPDARIVEPAASGKRGGRGSIRGSGTRSAGDEAHARQDDAPASSRCGSVRQSHRTGGRDAGERAGSRGGRCLGLGSRWRRHRAPAPQEGQAAVSVLRSSGGACRKRRGAAAGGCGRHWGRPPSPPAVGRQPNDPISTRAV